MALTKIKTGGIADNAITNAKMADDAIDSADFANASIDNIHVATGLDAVKLADGTVTNAEFQYINTLSSNAQTQISAKAPIASPTFTGNFTSVGIDDNADATAITIDSSERVGIGVTDPEEKVEINGNLLTDNLYIKSQILGYNYGGELWFNQNDITIQAGGSDDIIFKSGGATELARFKTNKDAVFGGNITGLQGWFSKDDTTPVGTPDGETDDLVVGSTDTAHTGIQFFGSGGNHIYFGDAGSSTIGRIDYLHSDNSMKLFTNSALALTINSSQHATFAKHISTGGTYSLRSYGVGVFGGTDTEQIEMFHNGAGSGGGRIEVKAAGSGTSRSLTLWTGGSIGFTLDASQNGIFSGRLKTDTDAEDVAYFNSDHANGMYMVFQNAGSTFGYLGSAKSLIAGGNSITDVTLRSNNTLFLVAGGGGEDLKIEGNGNATFGGSITVGGGHFFGNNPNTNDLMIESQNDDIDIVGSWLRFRSTASGGVNSAFHSGGQLTLGADAQTTYMLKVASGNSYFGGEVTTDHFIHHNGLHTHVQDDKYGGSGGDTSTILRAWIDRVNWGSGGVLVEIFQHYYGASQFNYASYHVGYGYGNGTAYVEEIAHTGDITAPVWTGETQLGSTNIWYRELTIAIGAYKYHNVRCSSRLTITPTTSNTTGNRLYFYQ